MGILDCGAGCRAKNIAEVLPLAGKRLQVGGHAIHLGLPRVMPLLPTPNLIAHLVTFNHSKEPERFLEVARQKLAALGIVGEVGIPLISGGPRQGEPRRKILRIKDRRVIGFSLLVTGLTAEESLRLQEEGLGGRTRMGCGFFVPFGGGGDERTLGEVADERQTTTTATLFQHTEEVIDAA